MIEDGDETAEIQHERNSARNAQANARSFAKNGEVYLMQRKRKAAVDAGAGKAGDDDEPVRSLAL